MSLSRDWIRSSYTDVQGGQCVEARLTADWATSSYTSANGGECVEARHADRAVQVRDTKDRNGPVLTFGADAWRSFTTQLKQG